mgnify:CR=1 FL=1
MIEGRDQDRGLREYVAEMTKGEKVYMNAYTEKLYEEINDPVVCEDFLHKAGKGETCIVENLPLKPVIDQIEEIVIFRWNKSIRPIRYWMWILRNGNLQKKNRLKVPLTRSQNRSIFQNNKLDQKRI